MAKVKLIVWRCGSSKCGHEFYGEYHAKQVWYRRLFSKPMMAKCPVCKELTAVVNRVVIREIVVENPERN